MACAGTATAASLISGKQIKKKTVTSKQIKNGTLRTKDLHVSAARALKGQGGDPGAQGPPPTIRPCSPSTCPPAAYLVTAKAMLLYDDAGPGLSEFECRFVAGTGSDRSRSTMSPFTRDTVPSKLAF